MPTSALLPALLLIGCLRACWGGDFGCAYWIPSGLTDVCCHKCHPGNRMVSQCGLDPMELCVPCEEETYITEPAKFTCRRCTKCTAPQVEKLPCSSSRDRVCGCADGFLCADARCSRCTEECGPGEEPTERGTCRACPNGMFNDQIHQKCTPWRTSCPLPGQHIVAQGTAVNDSVCSNLTNHIPILTNHIPNLTNHIPTLRATWAFHGDGRVTLMVLLVCLSLLAIGASGWVAALTCRMLRAKPKTRDEPDKEVPGREQQVECSLCHPHQEQGGSLRSVASQGSESKLLPV